MMRQNEHKCRQSIRSAGIEWLLAYCYLSVTLPYILLRSASARDNPAAKFQRCMYIPFT